MQVTRLKPPQAPAPREALEYAVLLPCHNEAGAIGTVVDGFRRALPQATIYVYDNNSTDGTAEIAAAHGAVVRRERRQGKGHVVRRMFADIDADVYVLADGDDTYDPDSAPRLIEALLKGPSDVVNGARVEQSAGAYRPGHRLGNRILSGIVRSAFGATWSDMLSGYKVMSRRFVKSFPLSSRGFEIETELLIHTMESRAPSEEVPTPYRERSGDTVSKLRTFRDGFRILRLILVLIKDERPLQFFSAVSLVLGFAAILLAAPIFVEYARTGLVPRLPTAVLAMGLVLSSALSLVTGLILDGIAVARRESKQLFYLMMPPVKD